MPSRQLRSRSGQAAPEYVAVLAVVGLLLAGAGAAVAAPDLPAALVRNARVALCIVGGDICRNADARDAGLAPCDVGGETYTTDDSLTIVIRVGRGETWSVQRRSDGTMTLTASAGAEAAAAVGAGLQLGPVDLHAGAEGGAAWRAGRVWELPDDAALRRLLARVKNPAVLADDNQRRHLGLPEPTYRFLEGGDFGALEANADVGDPSRLALGAGEAGLEVRRALGRRVGRGGTTWYFDLGARAGAVVEHLVPGVSREARWTTEYAEGDPPVLTMRTSSDGPGRGRTTEHVVSLPLTDAADRAAAKRFLALGLPAPIVALPEGRRLHQEMLRRGTVQRFTYATTEERDAISASAALGLTVGFERERTASRRRLVDARVLRPQAFLRKDCTGV